MVIPIVFCFPLYSWIRFLAQVVTGRRLLHETIANINLVFKNVQDILIVV